MYKKSLQHWASALVFGLCFCHALAADTPANNFKFWVEFKDKIGTPYLISRPEEFLSRRAIERRNKAGVAVNWNDLPPNPTYIKTVGETGAKILLRSRWMNAVLIETTDSALSIGIAKMATVKEVKLMGIWPYSQKKEDGQAIFLDELEASEARKGLKKRAAGIKWKASDEKMRSYYGEAFRQIDQLRGTVLHQNGYRGKGVMIAVLDAGFYKAQEISAFESLRKRRGILYTYDFVVGNTDVYNDDDHGTQVLSCMAAYFPGEMIGTAPEADYVLLRTEDAATEFPVEEANWVAAAELADSMGADVINASVGYTQFDMGSFGHTYNELDGNTTLISRAANFAWERGIFVVTSAGNEGDDAWQFIGAPADAHGAIAVAAVDRDGNRAGFSSKGLEHTPTKPDMAAMGRGTTVAAAGGYFTRSNGTSFSSPVLAGMIACAIQYFPSKKPADLRNWLNMSGAAFPERDQWLGYGIPNFYKLMQFAKPTDEVLKHDFIAWLPPGPVLKSFVIQTLKQPAKEWSYTLKNQGGGNETSGSLMLYGNVLYAAKITPEKSGKYELLLTDGKSSWKQQFEYRKE